MTRMKGSRWECCPPSDDFQRHWARTRFETPQGFANVSLFEAADLSGLAGSVIVDLPCGDDGCGGGDVNLSMHGDIGEVEDLVRVVLLPLSASHGVDEGAVKWLLHRLSECGVVARDMFRRDGVTTSEPG
jgi:hypothetical protein